jgi:hypothetical protein
VTRHTVTRIAQAALALLGVAAAASCRDRAPDTPATTVVQFYTMLDALGVHAIPEQTALTSLRPFVADSLASLLDAARQLRDSSAKAMPDEKPPFADGDPFSSLFEGRSTWTPAKTITVGDTALVVTTFTYAATPPTVTWSDTVVVTREHERFVVADIRYGTNWDFGFRGRLRELLAAR